MQQEEKITTGYHEVVEDTEVTLTSTDMPSISGEEKTDINAETFLAPKKKAEEIEELQMDFKEYVQGLPRKLKRKVYDEKKFGNALEVKLREQRLAKLAQKGVE